MQCAFQQECFAQHVSSNRTLAMRRYRPQRKSTPNGHAPQSQSMMLSSFFRDRAKLSLYVSHILYAREQHQQHGAIDWSGYSPHELRDVLLLYARDLLHRRRRTFVAQYGPANFGPSAKQGSDAEEAILTDGYDPPAVWHETEVVCGLLSARSAGRRSMEGHAQLSSPRPWNSGSVKPNTPWNFFCTV